MTEQPRLNVDVIDLSNLFGSDVNKRTGKFVLVEHDGHSILAFGRIDQFEYHAQILAAVCDRRDIDAGWIRSKELLEIYDRNVTIAGGGWFELDPVEKTVRFYGYSTAYGQYDQIILDDILSRSPHFESYRIVDF